ncbi:MAG: signal recognition particle-docking protein FtsY [Candidatus Thermoplasmatota archaeon]|nr:signal recognition particle-docking protein FtsY [Candidatus Thermoplasmatota archaeon]MBS3790524.1 signal recognition particle-docking protein FtsY [Candidatus Thermoplasmatota archaeon]
MFEKLKNKLSGLTKSSKEEIEGEPEEAFVDGWGSKIKESKIEDILWDLKVSLLEADVALPVVEEIQEKVKEALIGKKISRKYELEDVVEASIKKAVKSALKTDEIDFDKKIEKAEKPFSIMFVGVNGTGKTTTIAKIGKRLQNQGYSCVLAAADTFRAGALEQIQEHGNNLGLKVIKHSKGSDPAAVAYDALEHAEARGKDIVLIDTAGRMQTNKNLMNEMEKIKRVAEPDMIIFVGDALAGSDAVEQAKEFEKSVGIDGVVLTKIDADAKGGAALSIGHAVGKPMLFVGTGEDYEALVEFDEEWMVNRLFD